MNSIENRPQVKSTQDGCKKAALQLNFGLEKQSQKRKIVEKINSNRNQLQESTPEAGWKKREIISLLLKRLKVIGMQC